MNITNLLENEINFDETICRFIKGKLKNRIQPLEYEEELSFIISLILCKIPFSFVRFGDGEEHIMTGKPFATARDKWAWNNILFQNQFYHFLNVLVQDICHMQLYL